MKKRKPDDRIMEDVPAARFPRCCMVCIWIEHDYDSMEYCLYGSPGERWHQTTSLHEVCQHFERAKVMP